ncbi:MAG TPA: phosphoribosyl-ATP diphosphatase [Myxococcota bacterium]|nr:phosphoribosyl-ATP diphosphatase [Myxococcota bacterium]HQK52497.1 phosphoribosyl-ATP diphosphatase [Myxococcota bacterium]
MLIPSIDLQQGHAVQLEGGAVLRIDAGDPVPWARRFGRVGEVAVIDLDAARGIGSNREVLRSLLPLARCRVGGGIRDLETAIAWLDAGAEKVILGTAADPALISRLPRERVIAAVDARHGEVVDQGWQRGTGEGLLQRIDRLRPFVGGFLVTFVEREGRLQGMDLEAVRQVLQAADGVPVTVAGGVSTPEEVATLDRLGADAQVGMALYSGRMSLADALWAMVRSDRPDGLVPTLVCDEGGEALGLAWSDRESLDQAIESGRGVYHSRRRGLWVKGETSGDHQDLLAVDLDCDRDALRFRVRQHGRGFCHRGTWTCFGPDRGIRALARRLADRVREAPEGSYTRRLFQEPGLLEAKIREEAGELAAAGTPGEVAFEAADVIYFTLVALARAGVALEEVEAELHRRSLRVTRRKGDAKPPPPHQE